MRKLVALFLVIFILSPFNVWGQISNPLPEDNDREKYKLCVLHFPEYDVSKALMKEGHVRNLEDCERLMWNALDEGYDILNLGHSDSIKVVTAKRYDGLRAHSVNAVYQGTLAFGRAMDAADYEVDEMGLPQRRVTVALAPGDSDDRTVEVYAFPSNWYLNDLVEHLHEDHLTLMAQHHQIISSQARDSVALAQLLAGQDSIKAAIAREGELNRQHTTAEHDTTRDHVSKEVRKISFLGRFFSSSGYVPSGTCQRIFPVFRS